MNKRVINDVKTFFEGIKVTNQLLQINDTKIDIFEATSKNVLIVTVIKKIDIPFGRKAIKTKNVFCEVKVNDNIVKMEFTGGVINNEVKREIEKIKKYHYKIEFLGSRVIFTIIEPRIDEIGKIYYTMEKHFLRPLKK